MADKNTGKKPSDELDGEILNAISAFESILEAMPTDRSALETLLMAYEQIGDFTKASSYLKRFANVLIEESDAGAAANIVEKLVALAETDPEALELLERLQLLAEDAPEGKAGDHNKGAAPSAPSGTVPAALRTSFNMNEELSFAYNLREAKQLSEEEYSSVMKDLTEMSSVDSSTTVSVLHVLESRQFKNLEKIIAHVAKDSASPVVYLGGFNFNPDDINLLPWDFMTGRGVFLFELIGKTALVVVMNPYDQDLRRDIRQLLGRPCHFYMALPSDFDKALVTLGEKIAAQKPAAS
jgi:tetratricopeptide (TPR) repeat protein